MYINRKDFELIYNSYFIMTNILADFDDLLSDSENSQVIDGQKKLIEIMRRENRKDEQGGLIMDGFTLWNLLLIIGDGVMYVHNEQGELLDKFTIGFTDSFDDLDGLGARIVKSFERQAGGNVLDTIFRVVLTDEIDENEKGVLPVYE